MIKYIRIKKHKALVQPQTMELGHINVICGKNNSGKTTVLEALQDGDFFGIGKELDADQLLSLFLNVTGTFSSSDILYHAQSWLRDYISGLIQKNTIWFSDDLSSIINAAIKSNNGRFPDQYLIEPLKPTLVKYFSDVEHYYKPVIIPPKRNLEFKCDIQLNQEILPNGSGIINRLFFLKNQDIESDNYKTYLKIYETFIEITGSKFNVIPSMNNQITLVYNTDNRWVPASDSGLGLSDVLIILSAIYLLDYNVFLLEEPENHLHAAYQRLLLNHLRSIESKQFIITTHSSVFLDTNLVDKIFYCENNDGISLSDQTLKSEIINSLGYSVTENLVADLIILVEGPGDAIVIQEMLKWMNCSPSHNIKFWPLGGNIMDSVDLSVFSERNNIFALVDQDPESDQSRKRFIEHCKQNGITCMRLERYSIENYFPLDSIRVVYPDRIPDELKTLSHKDSVQNQIGFKIRQHAKVVRHMKISDIEGTDLHDFLLRITTFFESRKTLSNH